MLRPPVGRWRYCAAGGGGLSVLPGLEQPLVEDDGAAVADGDVGQVFGVIEDPGKDLDVVAVTDGQRRGVLRQVGGIVSVV